MNYEKNYYDYIKYVKSLTRIKGDGNYYELHHIKLKSLGGTDEKENLVLLTAREHFLAHYLLAKFNPCNQTIFAFAMMRKGLKNGKRYYNSRLYEFVRKELGIRTRIQNSGIKRSEEFKRNLSLKNRGSNHYNYGKKGKETTGYGHTISEDGKEAIRKTRKQEGIIRRSKSEKLFVYFFDSNCLIEYNNVQEFFDKNNLEFKTGDNFMIRTRKNTKKFQENKVSLQFKPMVLGTYTFIGDFIDKELLLKYIEKMKECNKRGATWYNNGKQHKLLKECPPGWVNGKLGTIRYITYSSEKIIKNINELYKMLRKLVINAGNFNEFKLKWENGETFKDVFGRNYISKPKENILLLM